MTEDPLEALLADGAEVDREVVAHALKGIAAIDKETGRILLQRGFNSLDASRKVLAFVLAAKAAALLGRRESEAVAPSELTRDSGMPKGTVNPKLAKLHNERLLSKTSGGSYFVAPHQIHAVVDVLDSNEE